MGDVQILCLACLTTYFANVFIATHVITNDNCLTSGRCIQAVRRNMSQIEPF